MARVFSLKITPQHMLVMWVYIVGVETWCVRNNKLAKQNVSWVSCEKALPSKHSQKPAITICHDSSHSSHVLSTCFTSQECFSRVTCKNFFSLHFEFSHSVSHTTLTMKSRIKYWVQKIEHNYNQIWHEIKVNTK